MRIGTWNMAGWLKPGWQEFLLDGDCDVWLLTEVNESVEIPGYHRHLGTATMAARRRWAGVFSRSSLTPLPDPHAASAAAVVNGVTYCSSILPWRGCGGEPTWPGGDVPGRQHAGRTRFALDVLLTFLPSSDLVWGGDWNHALEGAESAGSHGGRGHLLETIEKLSLQVPTAQSPHRLGHLSIDHVAVPKSWSVTAVDHRSAAGLSDHDSYVVDVAP